MDDFNESFKSMDMEDRGRVGPVDVEDDVIGNAATEMKKAASSSTSRRQREPAGVLLPSSQSEMRSDMGSTTRTARRDSVERDNLQESTQLTGLGLSNNSFGLSDPLMGDFGESMNSLPSFQSQESESSSWVNQYKSMENVKNEKNPWDDDSSSMSEISAPRMITTRGS